MDTRPAGALLSANFLVSCPVTQLSRVSGVVITCVESRTYQGCIILLKNAEKMWTLVKGLMESAEFSKVK